MSSPRSLFRTVLDKNVPRKARIAAIDELGETDATIRLRIIAVTGGLDGVYRRRAVNTLDQCGDATELERLADDTNLHPSLRNHVETLIRF